MLTALGLSRYSTDDLTILVCFLLVGVAPLLGVFSDLIMGKQGFGIAGNAVLLIACGALGLYVEGAFLGYDRYSDPTIVAVLSALVATFIFLSLSVAKNRLLA